MKIKILAGIIITTTVFSLSAPAQQSTVFGVPVLGYALDREVHSLRPIHGLPGAAMFGEPVDSGFAIDQAAISSQQGYALATSNGSVRLIRLKAGLSVSELPVTGIARAVYLSPQGTSAAVISDGWIGFVTGLAAASPQVSGLAADVQIDDAAVSDDGAYLLAALADGSAMLFGKDGTRTVLPVAAPVSRVAFRPGGTDALAASTDDRIWLIQQTVLAPAVKLLASSDDGVSGPAGLGFVPGVNRAIIANSKTGTVQTIDTVTGERSSVSCSCKPVQLEAMATPGMFRLTADLVEPQYVFDGTSGATFFVPALVSKARTALRPRN
jgi:hypothetical protein